MAVLVKHIKLGFLKATVKWHIVLQDYVRPLPRSNEQDSVCLRFTENEI